jgi:Fe-coproporphyrin III synthase
VPMIYEIQPAAKPHASSIISSLPILILSVHSTCNCRCMMCDIWKRDQKAEMHTVDLQRHRASLQRLGVRHVVLTGGEPLLHNDLDAFCEFFRELDIRLTLLTTGLLLQKRAASVARLFDDVIVSLDGPEHIHDAIRRVPGAFALIRQGVAAAREHKPSLKITCRTTVQKANHLHLRDTVAAAKLLQIDSISFLAADVTSTAFNREDGWPVDKQDTIALTSHELMELRKEIELLIARNSSDLKTGYVMEGPEKLRRLAIRFQEHLQGTEGQSPLCNAPWVSTVVEIDGSVRPCFFHPPVGSLKNATLEEALHTTAAQNFRSSLDVATNPICRRCVCALNYRAAP